MVTNTSRNLFFAVFIASGFAGLIYESIWTHYVKLFLGHAAYAQTLVLAVFMGGMALGSWLCARSSHRWRNLLAGYAIVEAVIGLGALAFHPLYIRFLDLAYSAVIPGLGSPSAVTAFKWASASLFILPQSVLLGMTFPLLTAGVIRRYPHDPGATVAMLYFTNSIGAAVGVLASGFLFIAWGGLPGTLVIAGLINLGVAIIVWTHRGTAPVPVQTAASVSAQLTDRDTTPRILLLVAFLTGASSFIYEIGWIRMLNLVLSSSTHAFELMLSAFITGLALGGLWIRRRIDSLDHPIRFLAFVQMVMGALALATLPLYGNTFEVMAWLVTHLGKTTAGYGLFNLASHAIALSVMLPATFCAGMTLPLITAVLLRRGSGEGSIGAVYAFNTIGAIAGVFLAVHYAMPSLGLKGTLVLGAGIDIVLGLVLAWRSFPSARIPGASTAAGAAVLIATMLFVNLEPHKMASGVYRNGKLLDPEQDAVLYHRDGKTATVSLTKKATRLFIRTNGKPDASIEMAPGRTAEDEATMVMAGALALALNPHAKTAVNIGWGSGLTTHTLLTTPLIERVDSIEIEPAMIEAAQGFLPRVALAYDDPRGRVHIEDAKTFFSFHNRTYDIIVSEPSNPWVSGVAGLFSVEFYRRVKSYLNADGLLVQWLQLYEIDLPLVSSVFKALSSQFSDYAVYAANRGDILIVARCEGAVPEPDPAVLSTAGLVEELKRVNIAGAHDLALRKIGDRRSLDPLFASYPVPANSDYYPVLDQHAAKTRFLGATASDLLQSDLVLLPVVTMLGRAATEERDPVEPTFTAYYERSVTAHLAKTLYAYYRTGQWQWPHPDLPLPPNIRMYADRGRQALQACAETMPSDAWWDGMFNSVAKRAVPYLAPGERDVLFARMMAPACRSRLTPAQQDFVVLLEAVGKRNAPVMAQAARRLLKEMRPLHPTLLYYILSAGVLGDLSAGKAEDARALWRQYAPGLNRDASQSILTRLLVAHMTAAHDAAPASPKK